MDPTLAFLNPYAHGFARVSVAVPRIRVADPVFNAAETVTLLEQAHDQGAVLVAFPELGLSAYTCDDLFHQAALLEACERALGTVVEATERVPVVAIVGLPFRVDHKLYNCAAVVAGGRVLGIVPKTYLPNYGEFYEARQFNPGSTATSTSVRLFGTEVPFGADLIFEAASIPLLKIHVEICEDVWVPIPPSSYAALAGATVLVNLSASNITIGKSDYRHRLVSLQSARCLAAYLYSSAGLGESTTDLGWDGQALIYEHGEMLAESDRFVDGSHFITADVDLERVSRERMRMTSFGASAEAHQARLASFRTVRFELPVPTTFPLPLQRAVERFPYVPADVERRDERCMEVYNIQVLALLQRLAATGIKKLVIGVSGGLDSTHALLVCAKAMDRLGLPRSNILAYTMPGFATSTRTLEQAKRLMAAVGCTAEEIDIRPSCLQMLADIGHPYAKGEPVYDIAFENVQAGERTSHLFRLANYHDGIVVGTGDLSELALGWCTYGVGDHMSHYNVNASVPKTLIKHLVRWVAASGSVEAGDDSVLDEILATEVSPELVPGTEQEKPDQSSEASVGPYELQDFHLYYTLRYGFAPTKVAYLAYTAWHDREQGRWIDGAEVARNEYALPAIKKHLRNFLWRFFKTSQFKRSAVPNSPKVGSGGSLSPRGDWRAPSDSEAVVWTADVDRVPDDPLQPIALPSA
ncbi:NAD(+) synthase [Piscinibacter koreensis]|uniref:Glutamine-dependent NAD(+) synthetase n=1 Tax=Piscinibacter koreensis TaxID=2742824 RepID=A0A7Y6TWG3_9BURK|nr:NAD(+) synthase [Schlegelella koreensis]NUZ06018.1 NAD(+) synthase [Schlegelella koreensis]